MPSKTPQQRRDERLHQAATLPDARLAAKALAEGADPASLDGDGMHALMRAAWRGSAECCSLILAAAPLLAAVPHGHLGHLPLHLACAARGSDAALSLIAASDLSALDGAGLAPMVAAVKTAHARRNSDTLLIVDSIAEALRARRQELEALVQLATCVGLRIGPPSTMEDPAESARLTAALRERFETSNQAMALREATAPGRAGRGAPRI